MNTSISTGLRLLSLIWSALLRSGLATISAMRSRVSAGAPEVGCAAGCMLPNSVDRKSSEAIVAKGNRTLREMS
jgi:hypothetical protein